MGEANIIKTKEGDGGEGLRPVDQPLFKSEKSKNSTGSLNGNGGWKGRRRVTRASTPAERLGGRQEAGRKNRVLGEEGEGTHFGNDHNRRM